MFKNKLNSSSHSHLAQFIRETGVDLGPDDPILQSKDCCLDQRSTAVGKLMIFNSSFPEAETWLKDPFAHRFPADRVAG